MDILPPLWITPIVHCSLSSPQEAVWVEPLPLSNSFFGGFYTFDETIANVAAAFIEVDGVWYAPASELMELFGAYSSMVVGIMIMFLIAWGVFILLIYEPAGELIRWVARKVAAFFSK